MSTRLKTTQHYQENPLSFFEDILGAKSTEEFHKESLEDIAKYSRIAIKACHSLGKTWLLGRVVLWFLFCFKNSVVITTAPTFRQVKRLLWGEIRAAHKNALKPLGGKPTTAELVLDDQWYAIGFSTRGQAPEEGDQGKLSSFSGFHGKYVLAIFDEAVGIEHPIWDQVEGILSSGKIVKFICIANPTTKNCDFHECFEDPSWRTRSLSCFDSPNLKANGIFNKADLEEEILKVKAMGETERLDYIENYKKPIHYLVSMQWVMDKVFKWGLDHPLFISKVYGEFPEHDEYAIVQLDLVQKAIYREYVVRDSDSRYVGVDPARMGKDKTLFTDEVGYKVVQNKIITKMDTSAVTGELIRFLLDSPDKDRTTHVAIDGTGIGAGVVDQARERKREGIIPENIIIHEVHNAQGFDGNTEKDKEDKKHYVNVKAKMFDDLRTVMKTKLDLLDEVVYKKELPTIKFKFDSKGRLLVESKDDYKARTGKDSPDHSDSLALCEFARYLEGKPSNLVWLQQEDEKEKKKETVVEMFWGNKE